MLKQDYFQYNFNQRFIIFPKNVLTDKQSIIKNIVKGISEYSLIPFFGAGMSKPCGAMDWDELVHTLATELEMAPAGALAIAQAYQDKYGRTQLVDRLTKCCRLDKLDSDNLKNHLLILGMHPPLVYTTNYDEAIETAAGLLNQDYKKIVSLEDIRNSRHGQKQIVKFHGDFTAADSIVFTRKDYDRRLEIDIHPLDVQFRSHMLGKGILFLGYGFGDENIELIFNLHKQRYGQENLPLSYIISFGENDQKEKLLREKNIITLSLESPEELATLLRSISGDVFASAFNDQLSSIFKPLPTLALTLYDLQNLENYIDNEKFNVKEKSDKIRSTLETKTLAEDAREQYVALVKKVTDGQYAFEIKESFMLSLQHLHGLNFANMISIGFDLMTLSDDPAFLRDFDEGNWFGDIISVIEHKLGSFFEKPEEVRKWVCIFVLSYLEGRKERGREKTGCKTGWKVA